MRPQRLLAKFSAAELFAQAVRDRALAVLTIRDDHGWQTFKAHFLERDARQRYFVLDYQAVDEALLPPLSPGQVVGVSFRQKSRKFLFATLVEAKGHFVLDDRTTVPAVRFRWPAHIDELQRRAYHRTPVPEDLTLLTSLWPGGIAARTAAQCDSLQIATGDLADISCGGALIRLHQAKPPSWADGQTLGAELQLPDGHSPLVVDVRYRGTRPLDRGTLSAAVQFVGLELAPDGRRVLQRLAHAVQHLLRSTVTARRRALDLGFKD